MHGLWNGLITECYNRNQDLNPYKNGINKKSPTLRPDLEIPEEELFHALTV